jgi:hypothetical protein
MKSWGATQGINQMEKLDHVRQILTIAQSSECELEDVDSLKRVAISILTKLCISLQPAASPEAPEAPAAPEAPEAPAAPVAADTETISSQTSKRDFRTWVLQRKLVTGHPIYFGEVVFTLSVIDDKVKMTKVFGNGSVINASTPAGIISAYILQTTGVKKQAANAWLRLSMQTESGAFLPIGWSGWLDRVWDVESKVFILE